MTDKSPKEQGLVIVGKRRANTSEGAARRGRNHQRQAPEAEFCGHFGVCCIQASRGQEDLLEFVRLASNRDDSLVELVARRDEMSASDRRYNSLDDLVEAVGLRPGDVLASAAKAAYDYNSDVSKVLAAVIQPLVVEATIKSALSPGGVADRRMLHQHSGFVPDIAGPSIHAKGQGAAEPEACRLPSFEETISEAEDIMLDMPTRPLDTVPAGGQDGDDPGSDRYEENDWVDADYKPRRNWR
jgi:hypothetical protein